VKSWQDLLACIERKGQALGGGTRA
jgi:hypothetical protein